MTVKKIFVGSDHAGFVAKEEIKKLLLALGYEVVDCGTNSSEVSVDYPDFARKVCQNVQKDSDFYGVLVCGSGIGMSIAANRNKDIRCGLATTCDHARLAREHNNANVIAFGERLSSIEEILKMTKLFFESDFLGGRHQRRVDKLKGE